MYSKSIAKRALIVVLGLVASCGGGGGNSPEGTVIVPPPNREARFAYVANKFDNSVSAYAVDIATGRIKYTGKVAAGLNPVSVTVDTSGKYAYVANSGSGDISQYTIETDGKLISLGANVSSGPSPQSVTVDPFGKYAYVANSGDGTVSQYKIETDGKLISLSANVNSGSGPQSVTVDPSGRYAYVANYNSDSISAYTISSGALTPVDADLTMPSIQNFPSGHFPASVTVDPFGKYAYVANSGDGTVSQYTIEAGGRLKAMSPDATVLAGTGPWSITVDLSGSYAYVANKGSDTVSQYKIDPANGSLSANSVAETIPSGMEPRSVSVDRNTNYVYVTNYTGNDISLYTIDPANGSLTPNAPSSLSARSGPNSLAISHGMSPAVAVPKYAYVANNGSDNISQFKIDPANGNLSEITLAATAGLSPRSVAVEPSGKYAYVVNFIDNNVSQYTVESDGSLKAMTISPTISAGSGPYNITVDPSGQFAYVVNANVHNISQYTINTDGSLAQNGIFTVNAGLYPFSIAVDPSGKYAYVTNFTGNSISQFTILSTGSSRGSLSPMSTPTVTGLNRPYSITIDPSGKYAYVANYASNNVLRYTINPNGSLQTPVAIEALSGPHSVSVDPSGKYVYVATEGNTDSTTPVSGSVFAYSKDSSTGVLTLINNPASGTTPYSVTVDPSGKFVYVANNGSHDIWHYLIETNGSLSFKTSITGVSGAQSVTTLGSYQ